VRRLTIVGSAPDGGVDDMQTTEKVRIFDRGLARRIWRLRRSAGGADGDILIPSLPKRRAAARAGPTVLESVRTRKPTLVDGRQGLEVVRTLEQASGQLK